MVKIINHTTIVTNNYTDNRRRTYFTGPSRREIERTTQERVRTYSINDQSRPGRTAVERDRVSFYKPEIDDSNAARLNSMPSRYMRDNGSGKLEQVEARRERTTESYKERGLENELPKKQDQRNLERNDANTAPGRNLEQTERLQQRDMQRENETFERFKRERENPGRETEQQNRAEDMRNKDLSNEKRSIQQRENNVREEQQRQNNGEVRRQQFEKQNEMQEQRNLQRQRDNAVTGQQRNNENVSRQTSERQNSQREPGSPNERRTQERQPQSLQRMERPAQDRFNRSNSNSERQRSGSQQEMKRSTLDQKGGTPSKSQGGNNSPRQRN